MPARSTMSFIFNGLPFSSAVTSKYLKTGCCVSATQQSEKYLSLFQVMVKPQNQLPEEIISNYLRSRIRVTSVSQSPPAAFMAFSMVN